MISGEGAKCRQEVGDGKRGMGGGNDEFQMVYTTSLTAPSHCSTWNILAAEIVLC